VVLFHLRAGEGDFHRAAGHARTEGGEHRVGADEQFAAEAAADVGRDQAHFSLGKPRVVATSPTLQAIIWFEVHRSADRLSTRRVACGSIIAWD
jgi:hypothetical protein